LEHEKTFGTRVKGRFEGFLSLNLAVSELGEWTWNDDLRKEERHTYKGGTNGNNPEWTWSEKSN